MQVELRHLQRAVGITFILVTHDQEEALTMSDRIAVMLGGRLVQCDRPEEIYQHPRTRAVAEFIGGLNFLEAAVVGERGDLIAIDVAGFARAAVRKPADPPLNATGIPAGPTPRR